MNILRVSFRYNPKEAAKIMAKIYSQVSIISKLAKRLVK